MRVNTLLLLDRWWMTTLKWKEATSSIGEGLRRWIRVFLLSTFAYDAKMLQRKDALWTLLQARSNSVFFCFSFVCAQVTLSSSFIYCSSLFARITEAGRLGSNPGRVIPKTSKTVLATCPAPCSTPTGCCKETIHARCCHWLPNSAPFTVKVFMRVTTQRQRRWAPQTIHERQYTNKPCAVTAAFFRSQTETFLKWLKKMKSFRSECLKI